MKTTGYRQLDWFDWACGDIGELSPKEFRRILHTAMRTCAGNQFESTLSDFDRAFLEYVGKACPAGMQDIRNQYRLWKYKGGGSDNKLPTYCHLTFEGRRLLAESEQSGPTQDGSQRKLCIDIESLIKKFPALRKHHTRS